MEEGVYEEKDILGLWVNRYFDPSHEGAPGGLNASQGLQVFPSAVRRRSIQRFIDPEIMNVSVG